MKAVIIDSFGGREKLQYAAVRKPRPHVDELLIEVRAIGVNPVDWKIRQGYLDGRLPHRFPIVLGWDVAGVVTEVGSSVTAFAPGDDVFAYCRREEIHLGTYAEFTTVPEAMAAGRPANLSWEEAASVPLAALTAYQALFDAGKLQRGQTVLIHAAAGGVGGFAVQLAAGAAATVLGTASGYNHQYLRELACSYPIDYAEGDFRDTVRALYDDGVDLVLDCVGGAIAEQSADILKPGGRVVTIANAQAVDRLRQRGVQADWIFVRPSGQQLEKLRLLIEQGRLRTHVEKVYPLAKAAEAHERSESGHTRGKLVLVP